MILIFLTKNLELKEVLTTSFAVIIAIRITSYYSEDLSKDVAKMLPFAVLGLFLVQPSFFSFQDFIDKIYSIPEFFTLCAQFILFIILIEWILRVLLTIKHAVFPKPQQFKVEEPASTSNFTHQRVV